MTSQSRDSQRVAQFWEQAARTRPLYHINTEITDEDNANFFRSGEEDTRRILGVLAPHFAVEGKVVLEFGCGVGRMTGPLVDAGAFVVAADVAAAMLEQMPERMPEWERRSRSIKLVHAESGLLPLPAASVDAAFSYLVLHHIPTTAMFIDAIREFGRVLRPGGRAAFQVCNWRSSLRSRLGALRRGRIRPEVPRPFRMNYSSTALVDRALELSDLRLIHRFGQGTWHLWTIAAKPD